MPENKDRSFLIIGLGFVGLNLLRTLWLKGARVKVYSRDINPLIQNALKADVEFVQGDIRERDKLKKVIKGEKVVFNLAGRSGQISSLKDPYTDIEVNLVGQINTLEAIRELDQETRVIFPGSRLEYGKPIYLPVDEQHPL